MLSTHLQRRSPILARFFLSQSRMLSQLSCSFVKFLNIKNCYSFSYVIHEMLYFLSYLTLKTIINSLSLSLSLSSKAIYGNNDKCSHHTYTYGIRYTHTYTRVCLYVNVMNSFTVSCSSSFRSWVRFNFWKPAEEDTAAAAERKTRPASEIEN